MPNWCKNTLIVNDFDYDRLDKFILDFTVNNNFNIDFNKIIPEPDIYQKDYFMSEEQHQWRLKNWGCKWNVSEFKIVSYDPFTVNFLTPWSPPFPIIDELSKKYMSITFELIYSEPGMAFEGIYILNHNLKIKIDEYWMEKSASS